MVVPETSRKKKQPKKTLLVPSSVGNCNYIVLERSYEVKHLFLRTLLAVQLS